MDHYWDALSQYAVFRGRARRAEYWEFTLINGAIFVLLILFGAVEGDIASALAMIFVVIMFLPSWAVTVRRLHDTGRTGAWALISLIPFGEIVLFIFMVEDSQPGTNRYGPNPKEIYDFEYEYPSPSAVEAPTEPQA